MQIGRRGGAGVLAASLAAGFCVAGLSGAGLPATGQAAVGATNPAARSLPTREITIGKSVEGRAIRALEYGDPQAQRVVVIIGQMHGTETGGLPIVRRLRDLGAPAGVHMWLIPTVNPDGLAAGTRQNARGVDINRNSSDHWRPSDSQIYNPGPAPVSEPETRATLDFLDQTDPDLVLVFHQAGNGIDTYRAKLPAFMPPLATHFRLPAREFACGGVCSGTLTGWFNSRHSGAAVTVELPATVTQVAVRRWAGASAWAARTVPKA